MSKAIWKFTLEFISNQTIELPAQAKILSVQRQKGDLQLWAIVDTNYRHYLEERHIAIYCTGHVLPDDCGIYLSTFQVSEGDLVFHVFEEGEPK
jgi:hypothetical protein